eukprot:COSAG03_NODE_298_length_9236_cov_126.932253_11_plen_250_part_00
MFTTCVRACGLIARRASAADCVRRLSVPLCLSVQYHVDGRTTWTNPLGSDAAAAAGHSAVASSPRSIRREVEARISARHKERAATLALAAVMHESPEIASKLASLQKGRAARGQRKPTRRQARRTGDSKQQQQQEQQKGQQDAEECLEEPAPSGWALGLGEILEASSLADGSIDQLAFDGMVETAEQEQKEARTPRTPVGRAADEDCPPPPVTPPPASGAHARVLQLDVCAGRGGEGGGGSASERLWLL